MKAAGALGARALLDVLSRAVAASAVSGVVVFDATGVIIPAGNASATLRVISG